MAIEKIYDYYGRFDELQTVSVWGSCRYTKNFEKAMKLAVDKDSSCNSEYGIKLFEVPLTWKHLLKIAQRQAEDRLKNPKEFYNDSFWVGLYERVLTYK